MEPVSICRFDDHIIRLLRIGRFPEDRLVLVSYVAGEYDLALFLSFRHPDLNTGRPQQMPHIRKTDIDPFTELDPLSITAGPEQLDRIQRVLHHINRLIFRIAGTLALSVAPLCLKFLDVGAVAKHDITQVRCSKGAYHLALEAFLHQLRDHARMVDMGMGQQHIIDLILRDRKPGILIQVDPLFHTAVHQNVLPCRLQQMTASCHLMGSPNKCQFHSLHHALLQDPYPGPGRSGLNIPVSGYGSCKLK